jgi:beta-galactosidase
MAHTDPVVCAIFFWSLKIKPRPARILNIMDIEHMKRLTRMRMQLLMIAALTSTVMVSCQSNSASKKTLDVRHRMSFNDGWGFKLNADTNAVSDWRVVTLPHDWSIEGPFSADAPAGVGGGGLPGGIGWYRKAFRLEDLAADKKVFIDFDGIYWNSDVWINGIHLGHRPNGYISFRYDITKHLKRGQENVIVVRADNSRQPNSRWYSGSGIYRNVWLTITNLTYVAYNGTFVTTPSVTDQSAEVDVQTDVVNETDMQKTLVVETVLYDPKGVAVADEEGAVTIASGGAHSFQQQLVVSDPDLWSTESPAMYTAVTNIKDGGKLVDRYETPFGIRTFHFDPNAGFSLNGKSMKILGVCNHHDLGSLGAAVNNRAIERQLEILREMGVNAIRTAHNPPAPELLELCDNMGFLVMDEMFDMWKRQKSPFDYSHFWDDWHRKDLEDFIRRDRNHPSVIIWSIGNEIGEQWDSTGTMIARELAATVRELDHTRPITTGNNEVNPSNHIIKSGVLDLIGYNYNHKEYADFHKRYPGKKFIATETTSALATRGHYDMPSDSIRRWPLAWDKIFTEGNSDNSVSAYDNVSAPWGSTHEETWKVVKKHDHLSGMFIWTGFDYLGEPTPYVWPSRSSYFGVIDLAGFPKDTYYMYQSEWTDKTMLHVFPHWNWDPGQTIDVWAYYNQADEAELWLNGVSQGVRKKKGDELHVMWRLKFESGTIRVTTRKGGEDVLSREVATAGMPARIILEADRDTIRADGNDLSFITAKIVDEDGVVVPYADNKVQFHLDDAVILAATDNGDPTNHDSFQSNERKAFHGLALAIVRSKTQGGSARIRAESPGLESSTITITLK